MPTPDTYVPAALRDAICQFHSALRHGQDLEAWNLTLRPHRTSAYRDIIRFERFRRGTSRRRLAWWQPLDFHSDSDGLRLDGNGAVAIPCLQQHQRAR